MMSTVSIAFLKKVRHTDFQSNSSSCLLPVFRLLKRVSSVPHQYENRYTTHTLLKLTLAIGVALGVSLPAAGVARGATISFKARGFDSGLNAALDRNTFFKVAFKAAPTDTFVNSVTFDLSPDGDAFFDITPGLLSPGGLGFDFAVGKGKGLSASDITRSLSPDNKKLTLTFADGTFAVGDSFRFGIDTDLVGPAIFGLDPLDPGVDFGLAGALFSAVLSNGTSGTTRFEPVSLSLPSKSIAILKIDNKIDDPHAVPEPTSVGSLLAIALGAGLTLVRHKRRNVT